MSKFNKDTKNLRLTPDSKSGGVKLKDEPNYKEYSEDRKFMDKKKKGIKNTLDKAKGESMVGKLKRLIKEPKKDLYAGFKKQHGMK